MEEVRVCGLMLVIDIESDSDAQPSKIIRIAITVETPHSSSEALRTMSGSIPLLGAPPLSPVKSISHSSAFYELFAER